MRPNFWAQQKRFLNPQKNPLETHTKKGADKPAPF